MHISGHAEWDTDMQFKAQAPFAFGYADMSYAGLKLTGTSYDASVMGGSDSDEGIGIYPPRTVREVRVVRERLAFFGIEG